MESRLDVENADQRMPLGDLLAYHARRNPKAPAVSFDSRTLTYAELEGRANARARQIGARGVKEGDVVTIALPKSFAYYEFVFGIWKLGATPNNVSSKLPAIELRAIAELAKPALIICDGTVPVDGFASLTVDSDDLLAFSPAALPSRVPRRWKMQTSGGSTGRPKLILDPNPGLHDPRVAALDQVPGGVMLNPGPMYHNSPFVFAFQCLFGGGHVVEMERFDPLRALELIEKFKVEWVNFVPTMMSRIWHLPIEQRTRFDLSSIRKVWHMASPCPAWLKMAWIEWLGPEKINEVYGGTELIGFTMINGTEWLAHQGSVGKVQPGSSMRIINDAGEDCATGEIGEIYFLPDAGAGSTYEYVGAQAKSVDDWQTYGDLGHLDSDGYLYIADRRTDMIVSGGANIFPAEVEAALDEHPDILSSIVIGLPDDDLGQRAHAIVQLTDTLLRTVDANAVAAFLGDRLVRYKIPRSFEFTRDDLRDDAGKARRSQLRDDRMSF